MSFEVFEKLEAKVQQAIDTITLLQMEIEELKDKNNSLSQEVQAASGNHEALVRENQQLKKNSTYGKIACALCWARWKRFDSSRQAATKGRLRRLFMTENHSMSSGSSERMMPVLSAYR
ncbi:cell division protein ZapB [Serratia ureilytica]